MMVLCSSLRSLCILFFIGLCKREFYSETWDSLVGLLEILFLFMLSIPQLIKNPLTMQETSSVPGLGRSAGEGIGYPLQYSWASLWLSW